MGVCGGALALPMAKPAVSATRIEILLSESVVAKGQGRILTLPWTRPSSPRRREIIQRVGEAQHATLILHVIIRNALGPASASRSHGSGKRNFAGRDWRPIAGAERGRTGGIRFADRDTPH